MRLVDKLRIRDALQMRLHRRGRPAAGAYSDDTVEVAMQPPRRSFVTRLLLSITMLWRSILKPAEAFIDNFKPSGHLEILLRHAHGPLKGQVARRIVGRNVVTGFLSATSPRSGRDIMRRLLVPEAFAGSLAGDTTVQVSEIILGSGTEAETSADTELANKILGSEKELSSVEFDESNPYVTFVFVYDEGEMNQELAEAGLQSSSADFLSRKTFTPFTKTNEYTLELRWTYRF